jgi:hypothetical protein
MSLLALLRVMVLDSVKADIRDATRRAALRLALGILVAVLALSALGLALAALTVWLAGQYGAVVALLIMAGGMIVLAALLGMISSQVGAGRNRAAGLAARTGPAVSESAGEGEPLAGSLLTALAILAAAGILAARKGKSSDDKADE